MITDLVIKETLDKWKHSFEQYAPSMHPNRKTGQEVDDYFRNKYSYKLFNSAKFNKVVERNIMENECFREKLKLGTVPNISSYSIGNVYVGIDTVSGEFYIHCEEIQKAVPIYDDLFVYRGLDNNDLKNFVMVGQYIELTQR